MLLDDYRQDLVAEGIDVAFRFGPLTDSRDGTEIGSWPRVVGASPEYLKRAGVP